MNSPGITPPPASGIAVAELAPAEQRMALSKVWWRLIPLLFFCYIIAYIDRINVAFAKLHLREVLKVDDAVFNSTFGQGAGLFFIGYFIFEVPSNLILQRVGARIWIARIMIVWGLVSMSFMFLNGVTMFYVLRFLLGAAEAGFFPGVILYLTYWFPAPERARTVAWFAMGGVLAGVVGSPISGALLHLDGKGGLAGWQWLFLVEAIPAVIMGLVVLLLLPNRPHEARWLSPAEKNWVQGRIDAETAAAGAHAGHGSGLRQVFTDRRVWLLCLLYFLMNVGGYGFELWLPTIVKGFSNTSDFGIGMINAIPYAVAGLAMIFVARASDRRGERRGVVALSAAVSAIGFGLSAYFKSPYLAMAALTVAFAGQKSTIAPFWAMTTTLLSGTTAAAGIALINSVGNLGGWVGPKMVGVIIDKTGSNVIGMVALGVSLLGMSVFTLFLSRTKRPS